MNDKPLSIEDNNESHMIADALNRLNPIEKENILRMIESLGELPNSTTSDFDNGINSDDTKKN